MFDRLCSWTRLDSSCRYAAPASPWDARSLLVHGGKKDEAVILNENSSLFQCQIVGKSPFLM